MARTRTISDEQILDAARAVFLEEGYGAPTARIARQAGVSEATIFKRFETKQALFLAALRIPHPPAWYRQMDALAGKGDVRENLTIIAVGILTYFQHTLPQTLVAEGSRVKLLPFPPPEGQDLPVPLHVLDAQAISAYLRHEITLGRLRSCDTDMLAFLILGSLSSPFLIRKFQDKPSAAYHAFAEAIVGLLWDGIRPD